MPTAPIGTVTFVFTDIVGSTRLWEKFPNRMGQAVRAHDETLKQIFETHGGYIFKTAGDSFCVAFESPGDAVVAAREVQRSLDQLDIPEIGNLTVRIGVHAGPAEFRDGDYFGGTLNRTARIEAAAHARQILLSHIVVELLNDLPPEEVSFKDLGRHHLRSLERPEHLFMAVAPGLREDFPPPRSMEVLPNNLPHQTTSFIGRKRELETISQTLTGSVRLLTLTGTGGTGKTRLALEAGASLIGAFPDGVWLAELALLSDASKLLPAVTSALGIREEPGSTLRDTMLAALQKKQLLLILDNCEHLTGAVASLAVEILRSCPRVRMLATSRHSLGIAGESTLSVPPLSIMDLRRERWRGPGFAEKLTQFDAVRLFIERACAVSPDFAVTNGNAPAVAEICSKLDGIPLAIELAAARTRLLDVSQIAARLNDRFKIIRGGGADRLPHQQTLEALIDWSYDLLSEPERLLFRRLGIFLGGRSLEAIEEVCCCEGLPPDDILDLLQQLIEKSLVGTEDFGGPRYTLLESVWHYARRKLEEAGELARIAGRHADYFLKWAESAAPHFEAHDQRQWLDAFDADLFNFDATFSWNLEAGKWENAARLLVALGRPLEVRGRLNDSASHVERIMAHVEDLPLPLRAQTLAVTGRLAWALDRYDDARRALENSAAASRLSGEVNHAELAEAFLGFLDRGDGNLEAAFERFSAGLAAAAESGDLRLRALCLSGLGRVALDRGQLAEARTSAEEALQIYRGLGDHWIIGLILWNVATIAVRQNDAARAEKAVCEWAGIAESLGNRWILPYILALFAEVALVVRAPRSAARFLGGAEALREDFGVIFTPQEQKENDAIRQTVRKSLTPDEFAELWKEGREVDPQHLIDSARKGICPKQ